MTGVTALPVPLPDWSEHWKAGRLAAGMSEAAGAGEVALAAGLGVVDDGPGLFTPACG